MERTGRSKRLPDVTDARIAEGPSGGRVRHPGVKIFS